MEVFLASFTSISFVASVSGLGYLFISSDLKALLIKFFAKLLFRFVFSKEKLKSYFQNQEDLNTLSKICKLNLKKTALIKGSGVDLDFFKPVQSKSNSNNILFASRLLNLKGLLNLLKVLKE